jgi:hypothetical protein
MANEIVVSSLGDARTAEVLLGSWARLRADRNALPNHPALTMLYRRLPKGSPSNVISVTALGLEGYDQMAPYATEYSAPSNTALTTGLYQATIVRQAIRREVGWLARYTDVQGVLNLQGMAADAWGAYRMRLAALLAGLAGGFSGTVGSSGVDFTVAQYIAAKIALNIANATDTRPLAVLHARQTGDLATELAVASGGTMQWDPSSGQLVQSFGGGYLGTLAGVDIVESNQVATANGGADRAGGMFVGGAMIWGDTEVDIEDPTAQFAVGDVMLERERDASNGTTIWVGSAGLGVAEADDGRGISIITDA